MYYYHLFCIHSCYIRYQHTHKHMSTHADNTHTHTHTHNSHPVSLHRVGPVDTLLSGGGSEEVGAVVYTYVESKIIKFV